MSTHQWAGKKQANFAVCRFHYVRRTHIHNHKKKRIDIKIHNTKDDRDGGDDGGNVRM